MTVSSVGFSNAGRTLLQATVNGELCTGIPCTVDGDTVTVTGDNVVCIAVQSWIAAGGAPSAYSRTYSTHDYGAAITAHIDSVARARAYDSGLSIASYAGSTHAPWADEATAFIAWRDAVWLYVNAQMVAVAANERSTPTPAELVLELPSITWP